jgi:hypothetical protein
MQHPIHESKVNPASSTPDGQFVYDFSVGITSILLVEAVPENTSDFRIMHGCVQEKVGSY